MTLGPGYVQTQWMRLLVASLRRAGVEHFVVSPGSRSTPIVAALQRSGAKLHLCVDERAASFVALGIARASGRPAALVCTSGTAGAHYFPAVIEAEHACVPLLVLTADRPPELQANVSPQTIDQQALFGRHVRGFFDLGVPDARLAALRGLRRKITQAVSLSAGPEPGAVHLNVPAYKPLEPEEPVSAAESQHAAQVAELDVGGSIEVTEVRSAPTAAALAVVEAAWSRARRPVLFCGPCSQDTDFAAVAAFVKRVRWPVLAEVTHPLRQTLRGEAVLCEHFDVVARVQPSDLAPDLVVSIGATATSSAWQEWLLTLPNVALHAVAPHAFADPLNRLELLVRSDVDALFAALSGEVDAADPAWLEAWTRANRQARRVVSQARTRLEARLTEAEVIACLGERLRATDAVLLGNSLPIRIAETFLEGPTSFRCLSQRGTNGIDGLIAGAAGTALVHSGRTLLVLGDISALHDVGSLQLLAQWQPALTVCILDNRGGRIFDALPVARVTSDLRPWTTPHEHALADISAAFGLPTRHVHTRTELTAALDALPAAGPAVVVCRVDPEGARRVYANLREQAQRELVP